MSTQNINDVKNELIETQQLLDAFSNSFGTSMVKNFETILKNIDKLNNALSFGKDISKENAKIIEKIALEDSVLDIRKQSAVKKLAASYDKLSKARTKQHKEAAQNAVDDAKLDIQKIQKQIEINNQLHKAALIQSDLAEKQQEQLDTLKQQAKAYEDIGKNLAESIKGITSLMIMKFVFENALKANEQLVRLGKVLGTDSYVYRENLASSARSSTDIFETTQNLTDAFHQLSTATGYAYQFNIDQLKTQIKLTEQIGLQADEASQIQRFAILNNKTSDQTYKSFVKGLVVSRNQNKVGINFKETLSQASKISGQLAANLGYNPERIAAALVKAKALGASLEEAKTISESLLDFESSITNELKAELLTGRSFNLERARALSLQGDYVGVLEEINKQGITADKFAKMNVIQQRSIADAFGMQTDQLSEQLRKQQEAIASGKSLKQITQEEAKEALERQNIQERFNQSILKLKDYFANIVSGPVGSLVDQLSKALQHVTSIFNIFDKLTGGVGSKLLAAVIGIPALIGTLRMGAGILRGFSKFTVPLPVVMAGGSGGIGNQGFGFDDVKNIFGKNSSKMSKGRSLVKGKGLLKGLGKMGGIASLVGAGLDFTGEMGEGKSLTDSLLGTLDSNKFTALGAGIGSIVPGLGTLVGAGLGGLVDAFVGKSFTDDMISGYGDRTLNTPKGSYALNNKDTVIAGTNLFKGDDVMSAGKGSINLAPNIDLKPMIDAINEVRDSIIDMRNQTINVNMDNRKVGSGVYGASYKSV